MQCLHKIMPTISTGVGRPRHRYAPVDGWSWCRHASGRSCGGLGCKEDTFLAAQQICLYSITARAPRGYVLSQEL